MNTTTSPRSRIGGERLSGWTIVRSQVSLLLFVLLLSARLCSGQVLTHGPVVGGVSSSAANVFVRTDIPAAVVLRYGTDPDLNSFRSSSSFKTQPQSDFTKIIPLSGLTAETPYYLNVTVNGVPQLTAPFPTFTTFPRNGSARNFEFIVLTDFSTVTDLTSSVETFAHVAAELPAFVFIGGDFDHRNPLELTDKRKMFQDLYNPDTPFMSDFVPFVLRKFPIVHQWDDHDAGFNNVDRTYSGWSLSQEVFQEYVPTYPLPSVSPGIWQKFSFAQADCFVLDCRSQRDPERTPDNQDKSMLDGNALGSAGQLQWLENGLRHSTARWKIIFTSVVTNTTTKYPDGWAGYQTEWNALRDFINQNQIANVVFISGDLHLAAIDNGSISGFPEMCVAQPNSLKPGSGGIASSPSGTGTRCSTAKEGRWSEGYYEEECSGYGRVTVLQNPDRLILESVDEFGVTHLSYTVSSAN